MSESRVPYVQVAIAAVGWGTWSLFLRPAKVDPGWSSAIILGAVAIAGAPSLLRRGARARAERRPIDWLAILALGIFDAGNAALFFGAMGVTTIAVAVLSHYLAPVLVALFAPVVLGTPRARNALLLTFVALCGLALVLEPWKLALGSASAGRPLLGALLGAGSAVFYAANVFVTKRIGDRFSAEEQLVYHAVVSALLLAVVALVVRAPLPTARGVLIVAIAGATIGATSGLLFLYGLRRIPAEHAGILTFLEPLSAVLVALFAFGERPGAIACVGGAIVLLAGLAAVRRQSV